MMDKSDTRIIVRSLANELSVLNACDPESDDWRVANDKASDLATMLRTMSRDGEATAQACGKLWQSIKDGDSSNALDRHIETIAELVAS